MPIMPIILNSTTKYFATRQQCERNPLLCFNSNTENFYIVDRCIYANNNKKEVYCCVSMAKMVKLRRKIVTLYEQYIFLYMSEKWG